MSVVVLVRAWPARPATVTSGTPAAPVDGKCFDADEPIGELMSNALAAKIVRGWLMAKTEIPLEKRVLYTGRLLAWEKTTPQMRLREKTRTICTVMTDEDFAVLNRRLHTVPKE